LQRFAQFALRFADKLIWFQYIARFQHLLKQVYMLKVRLSIGFSVKIVISAFAEKRKNNEKRSPAT